MLPLNRAYNTLTVSPEEHTLNSTHGFRPYDLQSSRSGRVQSLTVARIARVSPAL